MTSELIQDLRFGLRLLRRSPGFAAAAALTLALGVGATTAVFSVASAVVLRPLQFPESNRVMTVLSASETGAYKPMDSLYADWRDRQQSFDLFAAALTFNTIFRGADGAREIPYARVSADFLPLIGVQPTLGRLFTREEDQEGKDNVALLDNGFWHREFAGDPGVLGQAINLNNRQYTGDRCPSSRHTLSHVWAARRLGTNRRASQTGRRRHRRHAGHWTASSRHHSRGRSNQHGRGHPANPPGADEYAHAARGRNSVARVAGR